MKYIAIVISSIFVISLLSISVYAEIPRPQPSPGPEPPCYKKYCSILENLVSSDVSGDNCNNHMTTLQKQVVKLMMNIKNEKGKLRDLAILAINCQNQLDGEYPNGEFYCEIGQSRCAGFAYMSGKFFADPRPAPNQEWMNSGNAWEMYLKNPPYRLWQTYSESIDRYTITDVNQGDGPSIPTKPYGPDTRYASGKTFPFNSLRSGDIVTIKYSAKYFLHAGVVITNPKDCNDKYILNNVGGMILLSKLDKYGNMQGILGKRPIIEVMGSR